MKFIKLTTNKGATCWVNAERIDVLERRTSPG